MANGDHSAPGHNGESPPRETEVIRPRRNPHSGHAIKKVHREYRARSPLLFWTAMITLLAVYMILLAAVRWHQRAQFRAQAAGAATETVAAESTEPSAALPPDLGEQISSLIAGARESAGSIKAATTFAEAGNREAAVQHLQKQLEKHPDSFLLKWNLARMFFEQGQHSDCIRVLIDALETDPAHQDARLLLAQALLEEQAHEEAGKMAEWILEEDDYASGAHDIAASAYMLGGTAAAAIPHLRRMAALDRDNVAIQNRLALAHMRAGEYDKALQLFQSILDMDPNNSVTYYNLAACYARQNMPEQSVQILNDALKLFDSAFISSWVKGTDFDTVRTNELFTALLNNLSPVQNDR